MAEGLQIREVSSNEDVRALLSLLERIWGSAHVLPPELLRAFATHGCEVLGAYREEVLVGGQVGFLGYSDDRLVLHSHITGVAPEAQHQGIGFLLKHAQRDWCLARGIDTVTWTFDPLLARNASFNLRKLGAVGVGFHRDFYGPMRDAVNRDERTDRVEVRWDLHSPRVVKALDGGSEPADPAGAVVALDAEDGRPVRRRTQADRLLVRVPRDYEALREADRALAAAWRDAMAEVLDGAFHGGYRAVDFLSDGAYVLERG
jgi:predicted GNAT superfamily acetyltransferase